LGRYLNIARRVSEGRTTPSVDEDLMPDGGCERSAKSVKSPEYLRLLAAGWVPKVRRGKTIWASPQTEFWYSEAMALQLLRLDEGPGPRSVV
jgi:hypothetical protein